MKYAATIKVGGEEYELCVSRISLYDEKDRPIQADIVRLDDIVELEKDIKQNHFISAYINCKQTK